VSPKVEPANPNLQSADTKVYPRNQGLAILFMGFSVSWQ
jgi:hypothetical protein